MPFTDRHEAGRELGRRLSYLRDRDPVVLALPRGGAIVADEIARELGAPLDVVVVRKLGTPHQLELAMGAIAEGEVEVLNTSLIAGLGIPDAMIDLARASERSELERRVGLYREGRAPIPIEGRTVILVDDGLATGMTARAAARAVRAREPAAVILAVPVGAPDVVRSLEAEVDEVVCIDTPANLWAIGAWYERFDQVRDEEVIAVLRAHAPAAVGRTVKIAIDGVELPGDLSLPSRARGVVIFAHGSGSSRLSPRNLGVARTLNDHGLGTLLFDLLTTSEAIDRANVFDIDLLASRLLAATRFIRRAPETQGLAIGYFGASTGAAAALWAASEEPDVIGAVVSRGGRPDMAVHRLRAVRAPTLLIVGGRDTEVLELNRNAQGELRCVNALEIVPRATHLFEERGALEAVAELASDWFVQYLDIDRRAEARERRG